MAPFRNLHLPVSSRKVNRLVKSENAAIDAYEAAGRERTLVGSQLSDWGESTGDDGISDVSDRVGVILAEIGEQEDAFASSLADSRNHFKQIRDTETSVQPSRDIKAKVTDELEKVKYKEPNSPRLVLLEQELVRVEAQNLVAEAQLTNVTRTKFKQSLDIHLAATIERAEKQLILARHGRRIVNCLDDNPMIPGDRQRTYDCETETKRVLEDAEKELSSWQRTCEPIPTGAAELSSNLLAPARPREQQPQPQRQTENKCGAEGVSEPSETHTAEYSATDEMHAPEMHATEETYEPGAGRGEGDEK